MVTRVSEGGGAKADRFKKELLAKNRQKRQLKSHLQC